MAIQCDWLLEIFVAKKHKAEIWFLLCANTFAQGKTGFTQSISSDIYISLFVLQTVKTVIFILTVIFYY